jgi:hypothetical protein
MTAYPLTPGSRRTPAYPLKPACPPPAPSRPRRPRRRIRAGATLATTILTLLASFAILPAAATAQPTPSAPGVLDGPDPALAGNTSLGLSVARDGSGALTYLKGGHVFASSLVGGSFGSPQQIDGGLGGLSSHPVVAATNGGLAIVAFVNGGELYAVTRPAYFVGWSSPVPLAGGASSPSIGATYLGKAYITFTAADGAGHDVRTAYYINGVWRLEPSPLNNVAADDAGTGSGAPQVAAAGDGVAIVAWGEGGHVFTRRVWGTSPSVVLEQADGPPPGTGCSEISADEPVIGSGGDSSYAAVAFHELINCGGQIQSRVLANRLHGSIYDGISQPDGLPAPAGDGADQPGTAVGEYGRGWVTSARTGAHDLDAMLLGTNETPAGLQQVNGEPNAGAPYPTPATAGLNSTLIAWQHDPGAGGTRDVRIRYAADSSGALGPEQVLSSPSHGSTDAASGIAADGDVAGDAAVAWVQDAGAPEIVVAQLYQPPASFAALSSFRYVRSSTVVLSWAAPNSWGPMTYTVTVDGVQVGQTNSTSFAVPLRDGRHTWRVTATNPAELQSTMPAARAFVDTVAPRGSFKLTGQRTAGSTVRLSVKYSDAPAGRGSGVGKVTVYWGDGSPHNQVAHTKTHIYKRGGRFKVRVVIQDKAGNPTTLIRYVKIASKPATKAGAPPRKG